MPKLLHYRLAARGRSSHAEARGNVYNTNKSIIAALLVSLLIQLGKCLIINSKV